MATILAAADGGLLMLQLTMAEEKLNPVDPPGTAFTVRFDENNNAALVQDLKANLALYAAPGGVLQKSGVNVTLNAGGAAYNEIRALGPIGQKILAGTTLTAQEDAIFKRWSLRMLVKLYRLQLDV